MVIGLCFVLIKQRVFRTCTVKSLKIFTRSMNPMVSQLKLYQLRIFGKQLLNPKVKQEPHICFTKTRVMKSRTINTLVRLNHQICVQKFWSLRIRKKPPYAISHQSRYQNTLISRRKSLTTKSYTVLRKWLHVT